MSFDLLSRLTLRQIRLVAAIAEHRQLSIAASELNITQPAASRTLAETEQLYGTQLFERHSRGMSPTEAGLIVARRAANILRELRAGESEVEQLEAGLGGSVVIGAVTGPALGRIVPVLSDFRLIAPEVEVEVETGMSDELIRNLVADRHDFVLARLPPSADARLFTATPVAPEEVCFLCRDGHPLFLQDEPAGLEELAKCDFVMQARGAPIRTVVEDAIRSAGSRQPRHVTVTQSLLVTIGLLERSDAIAPVSREVAELLTHKINAKGLAIIATEARLTVPVYSIVCMRERALSPAAARFKTMLTESIGGRET
ncbi:LysR family transcriptional regulator [Notoacmeibacter sp. MSK16QG-6]|uniref:LysR family transcriptional regulator n=1 Tax=Notoacmeibacter sp. MSK16QG-6 TaxID=2957982 RepID=UPI00209E2A9C|nr:LysR family transcriptional regulator [Notoacmeibacter sp. MSK16QG-6]MCP1200258.1 LysR family transcriptional regulator [Notoacmeibacter sp. MSK16QG-6]